MTEPIGFLNYGWSFVRAAEHVLAATLNDDLRIDFDVPVTVNVGHGIELMLKSYIWKRLNAEPPFTHDLEQLMQQAKSRGLSLQLNNHELAILSVLNDQVGKRPFLARYLETGVVTLPPQREYCRLARKVMDSIEPQLVPDRVRNVGLRTKLEPEPRYKTVPTPAIEQAIGPLGKGIATSPPSPLAGEGSGMGGDLHATGESSR